MSAVLAIVMLAAPQGAPVLESAVDLVNEGRCQDAEPLLRGLLRIDPSPEAEYFLGFCLLARFEHEEAEAHLRRAIEARRREHAWMHTLAKSLLDRGRSGEALELLDRALAIRDRSEYRFAKAVCAVDLGRLDVAERELELALGAEKPIRFLDGERVVDGRAEAFYQLGRLLALRGRDRESLEALERASNIDPAHLETRLHLGLAHRRLGQLEQARASLEGVVRERPMHFAALYALYQTHLAAGDRKAARELTERLESLGALQGEIRFLLSAADSLERTLSVGLDDEQARRSIVEKRIALGERLVQAGRAEEALQHLLAARRLEPERAETYRRLAAVFQLLGRSADADMAEGIARELAASRF